MSNIQVQGNASGAGTQTLQSANTSSTTTLTLPAVTSNDTIAALGIAQTFTAAQTFNSGNLKLAGSTSGTVTLNPQAAAGTTTITLPSAASTLGYINAPQTSGGSSAYTLVATDAGKHIYFTGGTTATLTVPTDAGISPDSWPVGTIIAVVNNNSGNLTISGSGVTFQLANGGTGNRTVATKGVASLINVATNTWYVSGAGVT